MISLRRLAFCCTKSKYWPFHRKEVVEIQYPRYTDSHQGGEAGVAKSRLFSPLWLMLHKMQPEEGHNAALIGAVLAQTRRRCAPYLKGSLPPYHLLDALLAQIRSVETAGGNYRLYKEQYLRSHSWPCCTNERRSAVHRFSEKSFL